MKSHNNSSSASRYKVEKGETQSSNITNVNIELLTPLQGAFPSFASPCIEERAIIMLDVV